MSEPDDVIEFMPEMLAWTGTEAEMKDALGDALEYWVTTDHDDDAIDVMWLQGWLDSVSMHRERLDD